MSSPSTQRTRILTIDPTPLGFGFAMFEERRGLIGWGIRDARENRNSLGVARLRELLDRYTPDTVVIEDYRLWDARRPARVRQLMKSVARLAVTRGIETVRISPKMRVEAMAETGASTKREIAIALAGRFPELADALPPVRRLWMSEDYSMAVFDAVALGVAFFYAGQWEEGEVA